MTFTTNHEAKHIELHPISRDHVKKSFEWISNPKFREDFMVRGEINWEKHIDYFETLINDSSQKGYAIFTANLHIGNCGYKYLNNTEKSAELWIYIGSTEARGLGLGGHALNKIISKGETELGLDSIYVHVACDNKSARRLYESSGFFENGECSDEWKNRKINMLRMLWRA